MLFYDGEVDIALVHGQNIARELLNAKSLFRIMLLANTGIGLLDRYASPNDGEKPVDLARHLFIVTVVRPLRLVHHHVGSVERR